MLTWSYTSTHLRDSLHIGLDLLPWALSKEWPGQKALSNFPTSRRNASFTTERNVRPRSTWIKLKAIVAANPGLSSLTSTNIRSLAFVTSISIWQDFTYCGPLEEECVRNQTTKDKNCLISCTGLYADITDDSLKQSAQAFERYVIKGTLDIWCILIVHPYVRLRFPHIDWEAG